MGEKIAAWKTQDKNQNDVISIKIGGKTYWLYNNDRKEQRIKDMMAQDNYDHSVEKWPDYTGFEIGGN